jgi:hypothetical protein
MKNPLRVLCFSRCLLVRFMHKPEHIEYGRPLQHNIELAKAQKANAVHPAEK